MLNKRDTSGRQFIAMHEVRSALVSAAASLTTGTASSLIAGDTDYLLDIVEITFANNTTLAGGVIGISLINDGTTIRNIQVAPGTTQLTFDTPLKQQTKNTPWIVDMDDVTGNTVVIGATLIKALN